MTTPPIDYSRLSMPLGEAIFTQRSIRKFRPDPISIADLRLIMEAAMRAPNGGNHQIARFLIVNDRETIKRFGALYREAWWAKRKDEKRPWTSQADIPPEEKNYRAASQLAEEMKDAPCVIFAFGLPPGSANSVIPAVQNLMLAARALGIGSLPTTLHASVMGRFNEMFAVPADATFHFCIPLGYPRGSFGPNVRKPTVETTFLGRWGGKVPWA
jgi:nitroreductase